MYRQKVSDRWCGGREGRDEKLLVAPDGLARNIASGWKKWKTSSETVAATLTILRPEVTTLFTYLPWPIRPRLISGFSTSDLGKNVSR